MTTKENPGRRESTEACREQQINTAELRLSTSIEKELCQNSDAPKKRDWKKINASRVPAEMRERGVTRYQWEQIKRATFLSTYSKKGPAIDRLKNGEKLPQVLRDLNEEHYADRSKWPETNRKIQKLWKCLLKAAKDYGSSTEADQIWFVFSQLMKRSECQNLNALLIINRALRKQWNALKSECQNSDTTESGGLR